MTSNLGSQFLLNNNRAGVDALLHTTFKPEFLNRIDEIIYFSPLSKATQKSIVRKLLNELGDRLKEQYYSMSFDESVVDAVIDQAYSETFGARPLKHFIQDEIETIIATKIIKGEIDTSSKYKMEYRDGNFDIEKASLA